MNIHEIKSLTEPGVEVFSTLTEAQLRHRLDTSKGIFIAESPKVIRVALSEGYEPVSLLCEEKHITGDAADIISQCGDIPVFTGSRELLASRYHKHRRHLPLRSSLRHRRRPAHPQLLRPTQPPQHQSVYGLRLPRTLDVD